MRTGTLIKESISDETILDLIAINGVEIWTSDNHTDKQPKYWTAIFFSTEKEEFIFELANVLKDHWYVDLSDKNEKILVFKDKIIKYKVGDIEGKQIAISYCRKIGIPESQIDWND